MQLFNVLLFFILGKYLSTTHSVIAERNGVTILDNLFAHGTHTLTILDSRKL